MTPTAASRTLTEALRRVWTLEAAERRAVSHAAALAAARTGEPAVPTEPLPSGPLVKGRLAALARAWAACQTAEAVYRAAREAWAQETGACPVCSEAACRCQSARRADSGGVA
jgi:hypothetical protein